eukprot:6469222-Amphidinium_carterae.5
MVEHHKRSFEQKLATMTRAGLRYAQLLERVRSGARWRHDQISKLATAIPPWTYQGEDMTLQNHFARFHRSSPTVHIPPSNDASSESCLHASSEKSLLGFRGPRNP